MVERLEDTPPLAPHGFLLRASVTLWTLVVLVLMVRAVLQPTRHSVYPIFARAGNCWALGQDLYGHAPAGSGLDEFRYAPLVAALCAPLSGLPLQLGGVLWRSLNTLVFLLCFLSFARTVFPGRAALDERMLGWLSLLLLPLSLPSLNNGQTNPLVSGLLLLALSATIRRRWTLVALCLAVPCLLKIYPLAVALLLMLLHPRQLAGRLGLWLSVGLLLPFVLQDPSYVAEQYRAWLDYLMTDDRQGRALAASYRDFNLLLRLMKVDLSPRIYLAVQLGVAAGTCLVLVHGRRQGWPRRQLLHCLLDLSCCWMTLFGPATESCTYTLLAPTLALAAIQALRAGRSVWTRGLLVAIVALFLASLIATALPGGKALAFFLNPLAALLLFGERLGNLPGPRGRKMLQPIFAGRLALEPLRGREWTFSESTPRADSIPVQGTESLMTAAKTLVSIVCPAYQEEEVLPLFHRELTAVLAVLERDYAFEVLYVDDGSHDGTLAVIRQLAARDQRVRFLSLSRNFGHQAALTAGLEHARGAAVISMDVDLQHPPTLLAELLWQWREGYEVVLTVRRDDPRLGLFKRWSSQAFYRLLRLVSATDVRLAASDFRLLSRKAVLGLLQLREQHRFLRGMVQWLGFPTAEVVYTPDARRAGRSKYTLGRMLRLAADGLFSFSSLPLRLPFYLGVPVLLVGLGYLCWLLAQALGGGAGASLLLHTLFATVLLLGGSILCFLGCLGEYVSRIYDQVKERPLYLLKELSPIAAPRDDDVPQRPLRGRQREAV
jgi:dolichol-phosphate mannosyltransferase